jgi:DNA-binding response OmpR family regulator
MQVDAAVRLLADDEVPLRTLVCTTLQDPAYRIVEASDGTSALAIAKQERLDRIILDRMLPDIDGIDIAKILRQDPETTRIPIIMLSARGQAKDQVQARALSIDAYLVKPFSPLELLGKVQALLKPPPPQTRLSIGPPETPDQTADTQRQLDMAHRQTVRYAHDLKRLLDAERRKSQELAEAHAKLHVLDRLKTDFLTFIAHELRTPLTHINVIDLYDPHDEPEEQAMLLDVIRSGYAHLEGFIQKGLEYFTWMATEHVATHEIVDLARLVPQVANQIPSLVAPGVEFQISTPSMPCRIRGEEGHLSTVVHILLDNALKFSPQEKCIRVQIQTTAALVPW